MSLLYPHFTHTHLSILSILSYLHCSIARGCSPWRPAASEDNAEYYTRPPGIVSLLLLTVTFIQAMALHKHTQGRFNNQTLHRVYRIMVMATCVVMWWKCEILCLERDLNLDLWHSSQCANNTPCRLPDVTTIPKHIRLCNSLPQRSV